MTVMQKLQELYELGLLTAHSDPVKIHSHVLSCDDHQNYPVEWFEEHLKGGAILSITQERYQDKLDAAVALLTDGINKGHKQMVQRAFYRTHAYLLNEFTITVITAIKEKYPDDGRISRALHNFIKEYL